MDKLLTIESKTLNWRGIVMQNPGPTHIYRGITALTGPNGAGKSILGKIIAHGLNYSTNKITAHKENLTVRMLEFNSLLSIPGCPRSSYYQQRYEASMNDDMPTVKDLLGQRLDLPLWQRLSVEMNLNEVADKRINFLSSGELRKLLIINQLADRPDLLILDNPYIGLDAESRRTLDRVLTSIADRGTSLILIAPDRSMLTECVMHEISVSNMQIGARHISSHNKYISISDIPGQEPQAMHGPIVELRNCSVSYGDRKILNNINWTVNAGESWALCGPNGSGKSTLLSLITADNPQAYRCDIRLFGRRRGSGESIWDIKRNLAYVSPEMHTCFNGGASTVESIVAHGLHDCVGDFKKLTKHELSLSMQWLSLMEMAHLSTRHFNTLSAGEQRMVLLARTFIKRSPLLILDEPLHGLDPDNCRTVKSIVRLLAEHSALIYITHNPDELPTIPDATFTLQRP